MLKKDIRLKYKDLRSKLSKDDIQSLSLLLYYKLKLLPIWEQQYYHVFLPIVEQKEVDTNFLIDEIRKQNKKVVVSKSNFSSRKMTHYLLTEETTLTKNKYNILEPQNGMEIHPEKIDVVFVPLLAFDNEGNRVGYGKGFYDNFLFNCKINTLKVGISFFEAEDNIEDVSGTDIKLDYCVTPHRIYTF